MQRLRRSLGLHMGGNRDSFLEIHYAQKDQGIDQQVLRGVLQSPDQARILSDGLWVLENVAQLTVPPVDQATVT